MIEASMMRRVKAHRVLSLLVTLIALFGWGAFLYSAYSASVAWQELRQILAREDADRDQLLKRHSAELSEARAQIAHLEKKVALAANASKENVAEPSTEPKRENLGRRSRRPIPAPRQELASLPSKTNPPAAVR
jgi:hypothetical protein